MRKYVFFEIKMKNFKNISYVAVDDTSIDLFEGQYVVPDGMSYNSYIILDDKIAVMDAVDKAKIAQWLENVENALDGRTPDYLVISHMEPDHSAGIAAFCGEVSFRHGGRQCEGAGNVQKTSTVLTCLLNSR